MLSEALAPRTEHGTLILRYQVAVEKPVARRAMKRYVPNNSTIGRIDHG